MQIQKGLTSFVGEKNEPAPAEGRCGAFGALHLPQ